MDRLPHGHQLLLQGHATMHPVLHIQNRWIIVPPRSKPTTELPPSALPQIHLHTRPCCVLRLKAIVPDVSTSTRVNLFPRAHGVLTLIMPVTIHTPSGLWAVTTEIQILLARTSLLQDTSPLPSSFLRAATMAVLADINHTKEHTDHVTWSKKAASTTDPNNSSRAINPEVTPGRINDTLASTSTVPSSPSRASRTLLQRSLICAEIRMDVDTCKANWILVTRKPLKSFIMARKSFSQS